METLFIGKNIIKLSNIDSTNNYANKLLRQSVINEGDVVITSNQTSGKGQRGNSWQSAPEKNLTFSVLLKPSFLKADQQFYLNKAISLAITNVLKKENIPGTKIKWPNDIYINNKKTAGILIENSISSDKISHSIVGIGLNVNQTEFHELPHATSLKIEKGNDFDLDNLLLKLLIAIEQHYLKLKLNHKNFDALYLQNLKDFEVKRKFKINNQLVEGIIVGINTSGQLLVNLAETEHTFGMKEIEFID